MARMVFTALLLLALSAHAQQRGDTPRWMSPEAGWVDEDTDTRVEKVERDPESGKTRVEISMPIVEQPIEEVVVVGTREEGPRLELPVTYEVVNDLDSGRSGIILYVGTEDPFEFRINYREGTPQKAEPKDPGLILK